MPILSNEPSTLTKTVADLKAELAAMEKEEEAEAWFKQEREEKKKKLAELAEARKAEEAAAAAAVEVAQKAVKKAAKWWVETQGHDKANKKQKSTDEFDRAEELAREGCRRCVANSFI